MTAITIRRAVTRERGEVADLLLPVMTEGETYPLSRNWTVNQVADYWFSPEKSVYVGHNVDGSILGTYYLKSNQLGAGSHVANCGYVVSPKVTGQGIATALCEHSLEEARAAGFEAMQFNLVVSTNERAVRLWHRLGFETVGVLPRAFRHPTRGLVDALIMYRSL